MHTSQGDGYLLATLNAAQCQAVVSSEGPLLVLAGAGTGKTRVLTRRIAHLLHHGVPPRNILAVTFTRKAAHEMQQRLQELVGPVAREATVATFHSAGFRMVRDQASRLGLPADVRIASDGEQVRLVDAILEELGASERLDAEGVLIQIARAKSQGHRTPPAATTHPHGALLAEAHDRYEHALQAAGLLDLDDLVFLPVRLLEDQPEVRRAYQRRWRYLLVDEYQDINEMQFRFLQALLGPHQNLCVVGDDNQAIYGFRGASTDRILGFDRDYPGCGVVRLEENYRCAEEVVAVANRLMESVPGRASKRLRAQSGVRGKVYWHQVADEREEAHLIADRVSTLTNEAGVPPSDMAVLARVRADVVHVVHALRDRSIAVSAAHEDSGAGVRVLTLHQAKGLEFAAVFLLAVEEATLPHFNALQEGPRAVDEERRLLYVGITRAKRWLHLCSAARRRNKPRVASRFLHALNLSR
jgi:superfamily I DNA/RNA helicase